MFMECPNLTLVVCTECKGTGVRGGKKSGNKKCRVCGETLHPGQVTVCLSDEQPCMHCPRHPDLKKRNE
jgi:hypothetical protein